MSKLVFRELTRDTGIEVLRESALIENGNEKLAEIKRNKVSYFKFPEDPERRRIEQFINREFKI